MDASVAIGDITVRHLPIKRAFDLAFTVSALLITFPVFITLAVLIRATSKGPAIYAHKRVGRGGVIFDCLKFRSMYPDADVRLKDLLKNDPEMAKEWEQNHKLKNDPRITPIGKFLRKSSLDELPQFLNVLKGDLSVVGPRPVVEAEVRKHYRENAPIILSVRPGITGLWQVSGRSDTSYENRVKMDLNYVSNTSFMGDLMLVLKTIPVMLLRKGAY